MQDAIWSLLWVTSTLVTVRSCATFAARVYPQDSIAQRVLHTAVLAISTCIISLTLLGAAGVLSRLSLLITPVVLSVLFVRQQTLEATVHNAEESEPGLFVWLWSAVGALIVGHSIVNGVMQFPDDYDCLMYHLPLIDVWIQTGSFAATESPRWSDSANSEVLGLWFCGPFSGDFLSPLNNLPVMAVWIAAVLELAGQFGVSGLRRHFIAMAAIAVYTTVHETDDASNDLMVVAFFTSGVAYALRYQKSKASVDRLLFGLSLGVLAGTKFFATGYALLLGLAFFCVVCTACGWKAAVRDSFVSIGVSLLAGGYWYVRNYLMTGYVFFPKGSPLMHERISHPDLAKTTLALNGDPRVPELLMDAVWRLCGPLHFGALLVLPTIFAALILMFFQRRRRNTPGQHWLLLAGLLLSTGLIAVMTPMLVEDQPQTLNHLRWGYTPIRYSLCFLTILMLAFGVVLDQLGRLLPERLGVVLGGSLLAAAVWQLLVRFYSRTELEMNFAIAVGGVLLVGFRLVTEAVRSSETTGRICIVALLFCVPAITVPLARHWHRNFQSHYAKFYSARSLLDELSMTGERILVLDERSYPFFGSARQNYVLHASSFRGMDDVREMIRQHSISLVVTRIDNTPQKISRYRPAWDELAAAEDFSSVGSGTALRMFRLAQSGSETFRSDE